MSINQYRTCPRVHALRPFPLGVGLSKSMWVWHVARPLQPTPRTHGEKRSDKSSCKSSCQSLPLPDYCHRPALEAFRARPRICWSKLEPPPSSLDDTLGQGRGCSSAACQVVSLTNRSMKTGMGFRRRCPEWQRSHAIHTAFNDQGILNHGFSSLHASLSVSQSHAISMTHASSLTSRAQQ